MLTKEKLADIIAGLAFDELGERILKEAQAKAALHNLENDHLFVSMAFHRIWAEICLSN